MTNPMVHILARPLDLAIQQKKRQVRYVELPRSGTTLRRAAGCNYYVISTLFAAPVLRLGLDVYLDIPHRRRIALTPNH